MIQNFMPGLSISAISNQLPCLGVYGSQIILHFCYKFRIRLGDTPLLDLPRLDFVFSFVFVPKKPDITGFLAFLVFSEQGPKREQALFPRLAGFLYAATLDTYTIAEFSIRSTVIERSTHAAIELLVLSYISHLQRQTGVVDERSIKKIYNLE